MKVHIYTSLNANKTYCNAKGKSMSWHEIKRGRITCADCLIRYAVEVESERK